MRDLLDGLCKGDKNYTFSSCSNILRNKKIGIVGDSLSVSGFHDVTWAQEERDRAPYSTYGNSQHWSSMICDNVGAILNNKGISGTYVFGDNTQGTTTDLSVIHQLDTLDKDIDYLIVFTGTNGPNLRDKNWVEITALGDENSPILSADPNTLDSTQETFTICGATKWLIEYIYELFPNVKLGFITPYRTSGTRKENGNFSLGVTRKFTSALRKICPLYSVPFFDSETMSGINWQSAEQRHCLMGMIEIVPTIADIVNFKIGPNMPFYLQDEHAIYKVLTFNQVTYCPLTWQLVTPNSAGTAYGDGLHISNSNGMRYLSYKYQKWIETL